MCNKSKVSVPVARRSLAAVAQWWHSLWSAWLIAPFTPSDNTSEAGGKQQRRGINCSMCAIELTVRGTLPLPSCRGRAARDNCNPHWERRAQLTETTYCSSLRRSFPRSYGTIHGLLLFTFSWIGFIARECSIDAVQPSSIYSPLALAVFI